MNLSAFFLDPFFEHVFMKRALVAALVLAITTTPFGVFLALRRMTLVGDAIAHALLPGVAVGFLLAGFSLWAMTLGGLCAALLVAVLAGFLTRATSLKEDSAFTLLYLLALACGVILMSLKGRQLELMHLLFGHVLAIDPASLFMIAGVGCFALLTLAALYRRLVVEGFDPVFLHIMQGAGKSRSTSHFLFFLLLMLCLVVSFQTMGTLMALGLMILPALAARFWCSDLDSMIFSAMIFGVFSAYGGLLLSYHGGVPSGPAIILIAGLWALVSAFLGRVGSLRAHHVTH
ncbi:MAG: metal ABC transporter permease [Alphaproteobacteria bacterium]|nr:metal ABC transporter permease [Alphaproteobacteria bacterium]